MKTEYKTEARVLRRRGYSLWELSRRLNISKSAASIWTKDVVLSQLGIDRVQTKARHDRDKGYRVLRERRLKDIDLAESIAESYIKRLETNDTDALIALAVMYWCEGAKRDNGLAFTNSDPELVRAFMNMLERVFNIDRNRLRVTVHLHDYHDKEEMLTFWSSAIDLPISQFNRPYVKESNHLNPKEGYKGCVRVTYFDTHLARVILSFAKRFIKLYITEAVPRK